MIEEHYHNLLLLLLQRNLRNVLLLQTKFMVPTNKVSCCCKQILLQLQRKPLVVEEKSRKLKNFTTGLMNGSNHSGTISRQVPQCGHQKECRSTTPQSPETPHCFFIIFYFIGLGKRAFGLGRRRRSFFNIWI